MENRARGFPRQSRAAKQENPLRLRDRQAVSARRRIEAGEAGAVENVLALLHLFGDGLAAARACAVCSRARISRSFALAASSVAPIWIDPALDARRRRPRFRPRPRSAQRTVRLARPPGLVGGRGDAAGGLSSPGPVPSPSRAAPAWAPHAGARGAAARGRPAAMAISARCRRAAHRRQRSVAATRGAARFARRGSAAGAMAATRGFAGSSSASSPSAADGSDASGPAEPGRRPACGRRRRRLGRRRAQPARPASRRRSSSRCAWSRPGRYGRRSGSP